MEPTESIEEHKEKPGEETPGGSIQPETAPADSVLAAEPPAQSAQPEKPASESLTSAEAPFPIVGVGASAGGLEAFTQLLKFLPADTGMGFVLVQHRGAQQPTMLRELLARATKMSVLEATDAMKVEPDHIYLCPPDTNMAILNGVLRPIARVSGAVRHLPIDYFLTSLAQDRGAKSISVILSGSASDGTLGTKAIKAEGGITFAQEEKSARYDSMPRSAIEAGYVDFVLPPDGIARELARIGQHPYLSPVTPAKSEEVPLEGSELDRIFILLRSARGVDFSYYSRGTIERRIHRRMVLRNVTLLADYVRYLREHPSEVHALYQDILINVTSFFREPEAFEALKQEVFPKLVANRSPEDPLRFWVPGCSTGEEAYSLAMCAAEFLSDFKLPYSVQIFATDISDTALEAARAGSYADSSVAEISPERLRRFFVLAQGGYQVAKPIRDMCVFARQNVIKDPPFSRLDLISCRNLLIYLNGQSHHKLMRLFHFALRPSGYLLLGRSETVSGFSELFNVVDRKNKIFTKKPKVFEGRLDFSATDYSFDKPGRPPQQVQAGSEYNLQSEVNRVLLAECTPPGLVVNSDLQIVAFHGRTGPYLDPAPGAASLRLLKMAREGLPFELRTVIHQAQAGDAAVVKEGIQYVADGRSHEVTIEVRPLKVPSPGERYFLVLFRETTPREVVPGSPGGDRLTREQSEAAQLRQELVQTKEQLQDIIEQQEASNEELRAANEEIESSNEEMQSTNEELETAKEELQATNEELATLNDELQNRNLELTTSNNDLNNVISNVTVPMVIVGADLRIRRFTPSAASVLNLIPADRGRPITDLRTVLDFPDLESMVSESIESMTVKDREVTDAQGRWHSLRVRPYSTAESKIEGAVITLVDIDALKSEATDARTYAEAIVETVREGILVLDSDLTVKAANRSFLEMFTVTAQETQNRPLPELGSGQWNIPQLLDLLNGILPHKQEVQDFEVEHEFPSLGRRTMLLNARQILRQRGSRAMILLAIEDITGRKADTALLQTQSALIDLAHDAIIVRDLSGEVRFWNQGAERKYGWPKSEALGMRTHDFLKTKFPMSLEEQEQMLLREGSWEGELVHTTRHGREILVHSRQVLKSDIEGQPNTVLEINRNITAYREAERQARREKMFRERLINSTVDGVVAVDRQRRFTIWNEAMELLTGVPGRDVVGQDVFDVVPTLKESGEDKLMDEAFQGHSVVAEDRHYKMPLTGKEGIFEVYASPIRDGSDEDGKAGEVIGCLGIIRDVTARKQAEAAVRELSARILKLQDEERRRIARELHDSTAQTLTALTLNLAMVRSHGAGDGNPEVAHWLDEARTLADQAANEIRNLSHLLHPPELDAVGLVAALRWYAAKFKERSAIPVNLTSEPGIGRLPAETESALFRVVQESLNNIQHHSGSRTAEVRVRRHDSELVLEVEDKGRGLPPEMLAITDKSIAKLGVGIAGMRERLRQLGGRLEIASTGHGTLVRAVVPWQSADS